MCALTDDKPAVVNNPESDEEKASTPPAHASGALSASGRLGKDDVWSCSCGHEWKRSIPGASALPAFTNGLRPSASSVAGGRRIQTGMRSDLLILASEEELLGPVAAASGFGKATWAQLDLCVLTAIPRSLSVKSRLARIAPGFLAWASTTPD